MRLQALRGLPLPATRSAQRTTILQCGPSPSPEFRRPSTSLRVLRPSTSLAERPGPLAQGPIRSRSAHHTPHVAMRRFTDSSIRFSRSKAVALGSFWSQANHSSGYTPNRGAGALVWGPVGATGTLQVAQPSSGSTLRASGPRPRPSPGQGQGQGQGQGIFVLQGSSGSALGLRSRPSLPWGLNRALASEAGPGPVGTAEKEAAAAASSAAATAEEPAEGALEGSVEGAPEEDSVEGVTEAQLDETPEGPEVLSVRLPCPGPQADSLAEALLCFGALSASIEDANAHTEQEQPILEQLWELAPRGERRLWEASCVTALFPAASAGEELSAALRMALQTALGEECEALAADAEAQAQSIARQDWVTQVQAQFQPVKVNSDLWVLPPWCPTPEEASSAAVLLRLEPGLAFGTGEHPTTRLCLRWLQQVLQEITRNPKNSKNSNQDKGGAAGGVSAAQGGPKVLDFGSGSGILSVAALRLGAPRAVGVDIDPMALSAARHNAALNGIDPSRLLLLEATQKDPNPAAMEAPFDVIVANILLTPLLGLAPELCAMACPGAPVGLSGLLLSQVDAVKEAYAPWAQDFLVAEEEGWALVSFTISAHGNQSC